MTDRASGYRHQHGDPRGLHERIDAQLRERIEEAVEMAALELLVELRKQQGRAAPEEGNAEDREAWHALGRDVLAALREGFAASLGADEQAALARAEAGGADAHAQALAGQVALARRLPDYWQRFDGHRAAYLAHRLSGAQSPPGWLRRLFSR
jgi:hypothetical protein